MPEISTSRPIDRATANAEIDKFKEVSRPGSKTVAAILKLLDVEEDAQRFFSSESNAFIFEKATVERFFEKVDGDLNSGECKQLMVILGAHHEEEGNFKKGVPTVILAGVNFIKEEEGVITYETLDVDKPATEYPPFLIITALPFEGSLNKLTFTVRNIEALP